MYAVREARTGIAVGGFGFSGPPDLSGTVGFGYGLIPAARGRGLATAAVRLALSHAQEWGATRAVADTDESNVASQRVLKNAGLVEVRREGTLVYFQRSLI